MFCITTNQLTIHLINLRKRAEGRIKIALARSFFFLLRQLTPSERKSLSRPKDYSAWLELNAIRAGAQDDLKAALARQAQELPLISIVMPVYRPDLAYFLAAIQSVERQLYPRWELCLCDDGNDDRALLGELDRISRGPSPISLAVHSSNRGIAAAMNSAAALAKGDFLLFLDQDDLLTPDCLGEFALAFLAAPDIDLVYSDSDKLNVNGCRISPSFKPGWSPWLLLSHMYMSHAVAIRRTLFNAIDGFASDMDGSQDYDLALRASEKARAIEHIPRVLYHWRLAPGSTALGGNQKPTSILAGQAAVDAAFARRGIPATASRPSWSEQAQIGLFQPSFCASRMSVSLIVLTDKAGQLDVTWLNALKNQLPADAQIIVIAPRTSAARDQFTVGMKSTVMWLEPSGNLADDFRLGLRNALCDVTLCIVTGVKPLSPSWVAQMCGYAAPSMTLAGTRVIGPYGKLIAAGVVSPLQASKPELAFAGLTRKHYGPIYLARVAHEALSITGECFAISLEARAYLSTGGGYADGPLALGQLLSQQIRAAGGTVLVCGDVDVERTELSPESILPDNRRDPWYNRNLGRGSFQFRPAFRSPEVRQQEPIQTVFVTHDLDQEGSQSSLLDLIEGLVSEGHVRPTVVSPRPGHLGRHLNRLGVPVEIVASPGKKASRREVLEYRAALANTFEAAGAQAVLANTLESYCAVAAASDAGLAALWWQHEGGRWWQHFARLPLWRQSIAFGAFGSAYRVIQVADATRRDWETIASRENFEVIRPGIPPRRMLADLNRWTVAEARAKLGINDCQLCFVLLGSISRRKAQGDVIKALAQMPPAVVSDLRILIVGAFVDPAYLGELQAMLASLPKSHRPSIELIGNVPDAMLYLAAADVFLCCSRQESAPRAIVEAMVFGLPVLTTPVDGIPDLVRRSGNALFYQPGNIRELSVIMKKLLDNRPSFRQLGAKVTESLSVANDYEAMVARFATLLREAAWQRKSERGGDRIVD